MVTMKNVAERAQVSVTTVSHVVNKTRFVSDEATAKVNSVIEELGYYPSAVARSLKNDQTFTIGMIVPNNSNPYFAELLHEIETNCFQRGYNIILCNTDDNPVQQATAIRVLMEKRVDGLIVNSVGFDRDLVNLLSWCHLPKIVIDRELPELTVDLVKANHEKGSAMAVEHLVQLGHSKIGCITGPAHLSSAQERLRGFRKTLRHHLVTTRKEWIVAGNFQSSGGYEAMRTILQQKSRPTAIFVSNDLMAIGALCAAHVQGMAIPKELSVVGFDNITLSAYSSPPLTTVSQPKKSWGPALRNC